VPSVCDSWAFCIRNKHSAWVFRTKLWVLLFEAFLSFFVDTVWVCNFMLKGNLCKRCSKNVGEIDYRSLVFDRSQLHIEHGCTTQFSWRAKFFFDISKGQRWYVLTHSKRVFSKKRSKINKIWGFAGQIKSFRGPRMLCMPDIECVT